MYTKEELTDYSAGDIRIIAESMGLDYTTKTPTINAIINSQTPVESDLITPVLNLTPEVTNVITPVEPEVTPESITPVESYYKKVGLPVGNDGGKIRYRLDGTRIN